MSRESPEIGDVGGRERFSRAQRACCDHAAHQRSTPPSGLVEEARADDRVLFEERDALRHDMGCEVQVTLRERATEKLRPGDRAHAQPFAVSQPLSQRSIFRGAVNEPANQETRIQVNHLDSRRMEEARRSARERFAHRVAARLSRFSDRCNASRAASAFGFAGFDPCLAARIARRNASDLETPQRRAMSSRARAVSTSRA